jgi:hypothetical protein
VISFLTYVIFYTLPAADPAALRAGRQPTPELLASIRHTLGLDKPWYIQYLKYLERLVFHFDFGYSFQNNVSVKEQIFSRLPATAALAAGGAIVWLLVGIPVGIISAIKRGTCGWTARPWAPRARRDLRPRCTGSVSSRCTSSKDLGSSRSSGPGRVSADRQHQPPARSSRR